MVAKRGERERWQEYFRIAGRSPDDLIIFSAEQPWRFNFVQYEYGHGGRGAGHTENVVQLLGVALEIAERNSGGSEAGYWQRSNRQLGRNLVDLSILAFGRVLLPELYAMLISAPSSLEEMRSAEWRERSLLFQALLLADKKLKTERQKHDFGLVADYWLVEFAALNDRTKTSLVSTWTSMIDPLIRGTLGELLCSTTNITPEATFDGKIILLDLPVKEFADVGQMAQVLFKHSWQKAVERRNVQANPRPVFLHADEAQNFVSSYDAQYQATCRSAKAASVLISQNLASFHAGFGGGERGKAETSALLGNLNTRILHQNLHSETNDWAASQIGRRKQLMASANSSRPEEDCFDPWGLRRGQASAGFSEAYEWELQPRVFTGLRTGGPPSFVADAIVIQSGQKVRGTDRIWKLVSFSQK